MCACALSVLALAAAGWARGAEPFGLNELLAALASVPEARASFTERKTVALLDKPVVSTGTLHYVKPDLLEKWTSAPMRERMTVRGDRLTLEWPDKHSERSFTLSSNPVLWASVEGIRATLAGNRTTLERFYWVTLTGDRGRWTLSLEPRAAGIAAQLRSVTVSGHDARIDWVDVQQPNGDHSVMELRPEPQ